MQTIVPTYDIYQQHLCACTAALTVRRRIGPPQGYKPQASEVLGERRTPDARGADIFGYANLAEYRKDRDD